MVRESVEREELKAFLENWKGIVNENYYPEFFFLTPLDEIGLHYETLPKYEKIGNVSLASIIDEIKLNEDPFYPEPDISKYNFKSEFTQQIQKAKERTAACISCQSLARNYEEDLFKELKKFHTSDLLEQRWLSLVALFFYQRNQITN